MNEDVGQKLRGEIREKIEDWLDFYRELEIDVSVRRPHAVADSPAAHEVASRERPAREVSAASGTLKVVNPAPSGPAIASIAIASTMPRESVAMGLFDDPTVPVAPKDDSLDRIREDMGDCRRCKLSSGRKNIVFGTGDPKAELVFVGEGPGANEDEQGLPFVGRAGKLLDRMIQFIEMNREDVYICNIIKCRPPGNRNPEKDEIDSCKPFLLRQIAVIRPRLICCLGAPALRTMMGVKEGISKVRGQFFDFEGTPLIPAFHPAYILRNAREESKLREDFTKIKEFLANPHKEPA